MPKNFFHNSKLSDQNLYIKNPHKINYSNQNMVVDINKLLNRVKINEKKEKEQKFILLGYALLVLGLMGIFILFIK
ncbi:hypothetical protein OAC19_01005 [Candidatus Pelagibacter sp.]|nr:hypothetical protein [Candidatus Pelagibacter sp.]